MESRDKTEAEKTYIESMSDYTITIKCDITSLGDNTTGGNKSGYGCCLRDLSQDGGGYCVVVDDTSAGIDSKYLTDANFETVLADPYDLSSIEVPTETYAGITTF